MYAIRSYYVNKNLNQLALETMASARSVNTRKRNQSKNAIENDVGEEREVVS